jgi:hypothetical protein
VVLGLNGEQWAIVSNTVAIVAIVAWLIVQARR